MTKDNSDEFMKGFTMGFEKGFLAGKNSVSAPLAPYPFPHIPTPVISCPSCGAHAGQACGRSPCYYNGWGKGTKVTS